MKRAVRVLATTLSIFAFGATASQAQEPVRITVGTGFGASLPVGNAADLVNLGWTAQGNLGITRATWPVALRLDVMYHSLGGEDIFPDLSVLAGLANVELKLGGTPTGGPFIVAGGGYYNLDFEEGTSTSEPGIFGGAGYKIGLTNLLLSIEAKFHNIFTEGESTQLIPFTVVAEIPIGGN